MRTAESKAGPRSARAATALVTRATAASGGRGRWLERAPTRPPQRQRDPRTRAWALGMLGSRMRRYIPALLLALAAIAPFPLAGCDIINKLKGGGEEDAGLEASVEADVDAGEEQAPPPADTDAAPAPTTTLTTVTPTSTTTVRPATDASAPATDAGAAPVADAAAPTPAADAGAAKADAGPAPAPTPTLKIPQGLFDAGGLRFDAGGFKPPWQQ